MQQNRQIEKWVYWSTLEEQIIDFLFTLNVVKMGFFSAKLLQCQGKYKIPYALLILLV